MLEVPAVDVVEMCVDHWRAMMAVVAVHERLHLTPGVLALVDEVAKSFIRCEESIEFTEFVGVDSCHGSITPPPSPVNEVVLRVGVKDRSRAKVDRFGKEIAPLVTSGPPGVTGFAGGRPKATEVLGFWPALIAKDRVEPKVVVEEVR